MSGIYIPGMEMPQTGLYFVGVDNTNGRDKTVVTVERMIGNRDVRQIVGSYELVPVPDHGDLIDRDETAKTLAHDYAYAAADMVRNEMPTIIPADKEEKG